MGVPAFFRWLSRKYPSVIIECVENKTVDAESGQSVLEDATLPNPNGVEFDNLYLDMNGIIHPCTHPEDKPPPKNEDEMMVAIFECIDRLFAIVRPRKVLYMAIDGVAPRAKMNQQRSRRFRAAKEAVEKRTEIEKIRSELLAKGCILPPEKEKGEHFDSNCITPGTPFMDRLSHCLHYYIHDRMNNNPAWKGIKVILSDSNSPGEGEHKIMDYIRKQRAQPDHDPNTQHVLCGADADLIMLGLATHEPNFTIIREEFLPNKPRPCDVCGQFGHEMAKCSGLNAGDASNLGQPDEPLRGEVQFIFVRLSVLREYLRKTLEMPNLPFKYDFERVIDDWVFMCFFVGNDFLPHLPSLEIRENAIDRLVELYKKCVYRTGGYLTDSGEVKLDRVQMIMTDLGMAEDQIFKERQRREVQFKQREKAKRARESRIEMSITKTQTMLTPLAIGGRGAGGAGGAGPSMIQNYKAQATAVRLELAHASGRGVKRTSDEAALDEEEDEQCNDEVRLWENGFKDRYYESKFDVGAENQGFRYNVALQYVRGLCWVLKYYYQGCASWNWYFPYHYAPFASDFVNITGLSTAFEKGTKPFNPLEQLMGVFPAASSSHVPKPWAELMSDPESNIIDFYPEDFKIDLNGKKFAWQGVALLPFVDEKRLFKALEPYYDQLTEEEIRRNKQREARLYITNQHPQFKLLLNLYKTAKAEDPEKVILLDGMRGSVLKADENVPQDGALGTPIHGLHDITENVVITVSFKDPAYADTFIFPAKRLKNAIDPPNVLAPDNRPDNYKPMIGFTRDLPNAYLSNAGHRMLNAGINNYGGGGQQQQQKQYHNQYNNNQRNNQYGNTQYNNSSSQYNNNSNRYQQQAAAGQQYGNSSGYSRGSGYQGNNYNPNNQQRYNNNNNSNRNNQYNNQGGGGGSNYNNNRNNNNNRGGNNNAGGWRKFT